MITDDTTSLMPEQPPQSARMSSSTTTILLKGRNYPEWSQKRKNKLQTKGLWRIVSGQFIKPTHPKVPPTETNKTPIQPQPADKDKYYIPQSEGMQ